MAVFRLWDLSKGHVTQAFAGHGKEILITAVATDQTRGGAFCLPEVTKPCAYGTRGRAANYNAYSVTRAL